MSVAELIFLGVVVLVGLPSARYNVTAAVLVFVYAVTQGLWYLSDGGQALLSHPQHRVAAWLILDMTVIASIFIKPPAFDCWPYHNSKEQLQAFWCEHSYEDRIVLVGFALAWPCYFFMTDEWLRWWVVYWISLGQFVAVSIESFSKWRTAKVHHEAPDRPSSGISLRMAWGRAGYD